MYEIYKVTGPSGKVYYGLHSKTPDPDYLGSGVWILRSIQAHGKAAHTKEVLFTTEDEEQARQFERLAINRARGRGEPVMNMAHGGYGGRGVYDRESWLENNRSSHRSPQYRGKTLSEEHKVKIGEGNRGKTRTETLRKHLSDVQKGKPGPMLGYKHTEDSRRKMSEAKKGKPPPNKGVPMSDEAKAKTSASRIGKGTPYSMDRRREVCILCDSFGPKKVSEMTSIPYNTIVCWLYWRNKGRWS